jgi:hypothetical protein
MNKSGPDPYEMEYLEWLMAKGTPVRFCSGEQAQKVEHYDFLVKGVKVEFKGPKSIYRGDPPQYTRLWVEWQNVMGNIGWVRGAAVWIVFKEPDGYLYVRRPELENLVSVVNWDAFTTDKDYSLDLKAFSRSGRNDRICLVQRACLLELASTKIFKK